MTSAPAVLQHLLLSPGDERLRIRHQLHIAHVPCTFRPEGSSTVQDGDSGWASSAESRTRRLPILQKCSHGSDCNSAWRLPLFAATLAQFRERTQMFLQQEQISGKPLEFFQCHRIGRIVTAREAPTEATGARSHRLLVLEIDRTSI